MAPAGISGSAKLESIYWAQARRRLASGRPRRKTVSAAIAHAVDFRTWQSLVREGGLSRAQATRLMTSLVEAA